VIGASLPAAIRPFGILLCCLLLLAAPVSRAADSQGEDGPRTVTVRGEGMAAAVPDVAEITAGVMNQAERASEAMTTTAQQIAGLIATLQDFGIAARDIETGRLSLQPVYPRQPRDQSTPPVPVAFRAESSVTLRLRQLDQAGALLDLLLASQVNRIDGIRFSIADPAPLLDAARRKAMADARHRAELYAGEAGAALGPVLAIQESEALPPRPVLRSAMMAEAASPIAPGESEVRAVISVTFALR